MTDLELTEDSKRRMAATEEAVVNSNKLISPEKIAHVYVRKPSCGVQAVTLMALLTVIKLLLPSATSSRDTGALDS